MRKILSFLIVVFAAVNGGYAQHSLKELWATEKIMRVPESVLYDSEKGHLYVSQIDGHHSEKDGNGGVAILNKDGKVINNDWVRGLNAPKGLGKFKNKLYVTDISEVVVIDIATGKITERIAVEGATFLNDITIDYRGVVYVSDSNTGKVHMIQSGKATTYLEGFKRPNGVLAVNDHLYVLDSGSLIKVDGGKKLVTIAEGMNASTDGIEQVKKGEFIVSSWAGFIYYVTEKGVVKELLNFNKDGMNTADIGYDAKNRIIYVPTFNDHRVVAFQLN
jgi:sugar lactone lactonase YvrE